MISIQYAAGFFDGEGSISITITRYANGAISPHLRLAISNMDPEPLRQMRARWKGSLSQSKGVYNLCLNGADAGWFLQQITPYLIVKARPAYTAVQMQQAPTALGAIEAAIKVCEYVREGYRATRSDKTYQALLAERDRLMKIL